MARPYAQCTGWLATRWFKLYEKTQETLSMLKLLAMTNEVNPNAKGLKETFNDLRKELNKK